MKRFAYVLLACVLVACTFTSCDLGLGGEIIEDETLIIGKWRSGTEYWRYDSDGYGATWDTADDVMEEEAQRFRWELSFSNSSLTHIHIIEITGEEQIPKVYTLTTLTETTLAYEDDYGNSFSFTKVN